MGLKTLKNPFKGGHLRLPDKAHAPTFYTLTISLSRSSFSPPCRFTCRWFRAFVPNRSYASPLAFIAAAS